jgi:hypothetical protein
MNREARIASNVLGTCIHRHRQLTARFVGATITWILTAIANFAQPGRYAMKTAKATTWNLS